MTDPASFIAQQNTGNTIHEEHGSLLDEILAMTTEPKAANDLMAEILASTGTAAEKKAKRAAILAKARAALDVTRAVRRAEKEALLTTQAAEKAACKEAARQALAERRKIEKAIHKKQKHFSLSRCIRRGCKLLKFTTGWGNGRKNRKDGPKREFRGQGCALQAAIVGHYGSIEAWRKAGSPSGTGPCRDLWPNVPGEVFQRVMGRNDNAESKNVRERIADDLEAKGY